MPVLSNYTVKDSRYIMRAEPRITFTDGDATPSVAGGNEFYANNSTPTTITNFDGGFEGQTIKIDFANGNTTIANNANIDIQGALVPSVTMPTGSQIAFEKRTVWREVNRSVL